MNILTVNLAVTLAEMGQNIGLLDADVFGEKFTYIYLSVNCVVFRAPAETCSCPNKGHG